MGHGLDPLPTWVKTPEQFIGWLIGRLSPGGLRTYFEDLEGIAKQTCDLELLAPGAPLSGPALRHP